jgi:hypothetical protein
MNISIDLQQYRRTPLELLQQPAIQPQPYNITISSAGETAIISIQRLFQNIAPRVQLLQPRRYQQRQRETRLLRVIRRVRRLITPNADITPDHSFLDNRPMFGLSSPLPQLQSPPHELPLQRSPQQNT